MGEKKAKNNPWTPKRPAAVLGCKHEQEIAYLWARLKHADIVHFMPKCGTTRDF